MHRESGIWSRRSRALLPMLVGGVVLAAEAPADEGLDAIMRGGLRTQVAAAQSQERIDKLAEETEGLLQEYRQVNEEIDSLRIYNEQLAELLESQQQEMTSLEEQIKSVVVIERQISPLMLRMMEVLKEFIERDVPFLLEERRTRVAHLKQLMGRSDVTVSEKYRRLLEAYQIENDYGHTIEAYEEELEIDGVPRRVAFLRIGRVVLIHRTLDGQVAAAWDHTARAWVELDREYRNAVRKGLRIARKQVAPDLLHLPLPAPEGARSGAAE